MSWRSNGVRRRGGLSGLYNLDDLRIAGGVGAELPAAQHELHRVASGTMNIFTRISGWNTRFETAG